MMEVHCPLDEPRTKGFHTFVMTGDAIIRTNFNPFKPTRQLSLDKEDIKPVHSLRSKSCSDEVRPPPSPSLLEERPIRTCTTSPGSKQDEKEFIPGFMVVEGKTMSSHHTTEKDCYYSKSGKLSSPMRETDTVPEEVEIDSINITEAPDGSEHVSVSDVAAEEHRVEAEETAKRLYILDGFTMTEVCSYLSQTGSLYEMVAERYMSHFEFTDMTITVALRDFFTKVTLTEKVEETEKVLFYFTRRYLEANPGLVGATFHDEDSCHTLVCALVLLDTDLHKSDKPDDVTSQIFMESVSTLNGGHDFPKDLLESCYNRIRDQGLTAVTAMEKSGLNGVDSEHQIGDMKQSSSLKSIPSNNLVNIPSSNEESYRGYVMKKHCRGPNGVNVPSSKRKCKRYFVIIKDLKVFLCKSEQSSVDTDNFLSLNNSLATVASHYRKRKHTLLLTLCDGSSHMITLSDEAIMLKLINTMNLLSAQWSCPISSDDNSQQTEGHYIHQPLYGSTKYFMEKVKTYEYEASLLEAKLRGQGQKVRAPLRAIWEHRVEAYKEYSRLLSEYVDQTEPARDNQELFLPGYRYSYKLAIYGMDWRQIYH